MGRCPACGGALAPVVEGLAPGDARIFEDEPGDVGLRLDDGSTACPVAFGPYRVLGLIGKGGMGVVYHAVHESTREEVAIKTVRVRKRGMLHRIRREIHALARIDHPGLVRIIETGQSDGLPWYAMDLLRGKSLQDRMVAALIRSSPVAEVTSRPSSGWDTHADFILSIDPEDGDSSAGNLADGTTATIGMDKVPRDSRAETNDATRPDSNVGSTLDVASRPSDTQTTPISPPTPIDPPAPADDCVAAPTAGRAPPEPIPEGERRDFLGLVARLCGTLAYLHGEGIVHRDIKPQNVIIRPDGTPVLLDFGLASYFGAGGRECLEVGGRVEGTPEYMSPEQIRGEYVDARADLYAVGCILYEGVTGRVPFRATTPGGTLRAHVKVPPTPPRDIRPDVPQALNDLILHLLAKKAGERLGYARDIIAALGRLGCVPPDWATDRPSRDYLYRPGFVGRGPTLSQFEKHVRRALARPGHCIFLRGQSGVGKTRFIMEVARRFEQGGLTVATGECLPIGVAGVDDDGPAVRATPLHPFRSFLQMVADCCLEKGCDEVARLFGPGGGVLSLCEPSLANLPGLAGGQVGPAEGEGEGALQTRLIEALGGTLAEFGRTSPVVVFLDDLEWADALTLHFLALFHVGVWDSPNVAIVAAYRSGGKMPRSATIARSSGTRPSWTSARSGRPASARSSATCSARNEVDDRFVAHLARRSGGNPFFVAEYLRAAVAEGLAPPGRGGDAGVPGPRGRRAWPGSGLGARHRGPRRRRSPCPPRSTTSSSAASPASPTAPGGSSSWPRSSAGRSTPRLLEAADLLGEDDTMAAVESLLVAQVLEESRDGRFRFAHDKLREVAYEQIPPPRRRDLAPVGGPGDRGPAPMVRKDGRGTRPRSPTTGTARSATAGPSPRPSPGPSAISRPRPGSRSTPGCPPRPSSSAGPPRGSWGSTSPEGPVPTAEAMTREMAGIRDTLADRRPAELIGPAAFGRPRGRSHDRAPAEHPAARLPQQPAQPVRADGLEEPRPDDLEGPRPDGPVGLRDVHARRADHPRRPSSGPRVRRPGGRPRSPGRRLADGRRALPAGVVRRPLGRPDPRSPAPTSTKGPAPAWPRATCSMLATTTPRTCPCWPPPENRSRR